MGSDSGTKEIPVWRASHPRFAGLDRIPGRLDFGDIRRNPENRTLPGLLMARPENGLFFANVAGFRERIIVEMRSSADMLAELGEELQGRNRVKIFLKAHIHWKQTG